MPDSFAARFRSGFRRHAAGVAIVAASTPEGPVGLTVSSVASVSVTPPMLSFSVSRASSSGVALVQSPRIVVHLLPADRVDLAEAFAAPDGRRFSPEQGWTTAADGTPHLPDAVATFGGRVVRVVPAGGSWLVLLEVDETGLGPEADPLVHHDRAYWSTASVVPVRLTG